ncbi:hypothetical protein BDN71DRAFT_921062 [Pleurotus eryngii]|uniref:Uncharacterized protein n=1 Tax=Pleurotus eryngii TaxID=5323 RepID=A0A9P5ZVY4_PLEER|nr:hypothetical protein BDN71DRAFT_921062 [Pleurotus eryngii]
MTKSPVSKQGCAGKLQQLAIFGQRRRRRRFERNSALGPGGCRGLDTYMYRTNKSTCIIRVRYLLCLYLSFAAFHKDDRPAHDELEGKEISMVLDGTRTWLAQFWGCEPFHLD